MKIQLLFTAMLFIACFASAQDRYFPGYIVKASGDTVKGFIKEDMNSNLSQKVFFKAEDSHNATSYTTKEIQAFGFEGTIFRELNYFDELDSVQKNQFGKLLVEGYYNLYGLYFGVAEHYFYVTSQQGKNFFLYDDLLSNTVEASRKGNYRNHLYFIGQSCPNAMSKVESMSFTDKDLTRFVQQANICIEPGKASSVHLNKSRTELKGVYLFAAGMPIGKGESEVMGQLLARFVSSSLSRKASFNVGFEYLRYSSPTVTYVSTLSTEDHHSVTEIYAIPFQLQYNFLTSWFQPYICTGLSAVYKIDRQIAKLTTIGYTSTGSTSKKDINASFPIAIGIEIYPTSHFLFKAEFRDEVFIHYPVVGIALKF